MTLLDTAFYFFAAVTVISGIIVVFSRNVIYAAFALLFTLLGAAGLFVLLNADFLAVTQVLVYVGGILVLMLFGVMLTNRVVNVEIKTGTLQTVPAAIIIALLGGVLGGVFWVTDWRILYGGADLATTAPEIGRMFVTDYILAFEVVAIVLLVAMLGAGIMARRERERKQ